jgi:hypothetical protein
MELFGTAHSGKLFWTWGAYAGVVSVLCQLIAAAHVPALVAWLLAGALGAATLAATEEL